MTAALLLAAIGVPRSAPAAETPVLRILDWEDYLDPDLAAEFGRRNGVEVKQTYFESDTERDRRLAASGATGFDLVMVDQAQLSVYRDRGWIAPVDASLVPGLRNYDARWRRASDASATHGVPFAWGTLGIAYRADLVQPAPQSWLALLQPSARLCGKVLAIDDARELIAVALKAAGHGANSRQPADYLKAEQILRAQRPCVEHYGSTMVDAESDLVTGKAWAAMAYNSDVAWLQEIDPNIRYVLPREGGLIWADYLAVLATSKRKALAFAFLEFLSQPAIAARQASFSQAATPNRKAFPLLPAGVRENPLIYPSAASLEKSEMLQSAPPSIVAIRNQIHARTVRGP